MCKENQKSEAHEEREQKQVWQPQWMIDARVCDSLTHTLSLCVCVENAKRGKAAVVRAEQ